MILHRAFALSVLLLVAGCSPIVVRTTTYLGDRAFPDASPETRIYVEAGAGEEPALLVREVALAIRGELESRGFTCVDDPTLSAYVLTAVFGIDQGHTVSETVPQTAPYYGSAYFYTGHGYGGSMYSYGYDTVYGTETYREFDRRLFLTLIDRSTYDALPEERHPEAIVWQASCLSTGEDRDLRVIVRYLLAAAFEYFGEDTGEARRDSFRRGSSRAERFNPNPKADPHADSEEEQATGDK